MDKNRIVRPTRRGELAQHSEAVRSSRGGKCGGRAGSRSEAETAGGNQRVVAAPSSLSLRSLSRCARRPWGGPAGATGRGVSRGHSTVQRAGGWERPA